MHDGQPVLVTGATGNVGAATAHTLIAEGIPVRVAGTRPHTLAERFPTAERVHLDFLDPRTFDRAVEGCRAMLLVRPPAIAKVRSSLLPLVDTAVAHGVEHVVFSSVAGADANRLVPHHAVERHVQGADTGWTILRPGFFAQNLADAYRTDIVADDRIFLPSGQGRVAFIDARDIGEVAARVLAAPDVHHRAAYTLTGPEALTFDDVAAILTGELGRQVVYDATTAPRYWWHVARHHRRPWMQALVQTILHAGLARGDAERIDPITGLLLGRPARTLQEYVRDHRETWLPR